MALFPHGMSARLATYAGLLAIQLLFLRAMRRRLGPEPLSLADLLTGARAASATAILVQSAFDTEPATQTARRTAMVAMLAGIATDWVDGTVARRFGPTRFGAVMDIEADSLLTLAMALAAVRRGGLPRYVLIPPLLRYADLARTLRRGAIFTGDDVWWCRASGSSQMLLFLLAVPLARGQQFPAFLRRASLVVTAAQIATQMLDGRRRFGSGSGAVSSFVSGR